MVVMMKLVVEEASVHVARVKTTATIAVVRAEAGRVVAGVDSMIELLLMAVDSMAVDSMVVEDRIVAAEEALPFVEGAVEGADGVATN